MLPKSLRLARPDFLQTKKLGKSFSTPHFSAIILAPPLRLRGGRGGDICRFAIVTSAKLSKSAVIRNRLRRAIYSALDARRSTLDADIILFPKSTMLKLSHEEICISLDSLVSKLSH